MHLLAIWRVSSQSQPQSVLRLASAHFQPRSSRIGQGHAGAVAEELEWKRRRAALDRYMLLRQSDRASADRFLSNLVVVGLQSLSFEWTHWLDRLFD